MQQISGMLRLPFVATLPRSRMAEIKCVQAGVNKIYGGIMAACLSDIKFLRKSEFRKEGEEYEAAEIDGAIIVANKWHTKLILIESKKSQRGVVPKAIQQLELLVREKINIAAKFKLGIEKAIGLPRRGAFLSIRLP